MPQKTRVRDARATRRRILDAATAEFSAFGLIGARTARIAEVARANQRMIYACFGNKDGLFDAVPEHHISDARQAVTMDGRGLPGCATGCAQQVFDFYRAHPHLVRLSLWQSLERPELMAKLPAVAVAMRDKVTAIRHAQETGHVSSALPAERVLDQVLTLAHGNITAAAHAEAWTDQQRHDLGAAVATLTLCSAAPTTPGAGGGA
ncbi:TetR/AcrR family transcriptional regulator [Streptomyces sp. NPDC059944]|uniref:TetR/AcrR family transcriptional regulator n=1 Tax=unclassified Streptomyces TaxID=2593676 RepID=UPI0036645898